MNQYREGKVKSTSNRGVKEFLKPCVYKQWKPFGATACLLHNEPTSCPSAARLSLWCSRSESESEEGIQSPATDPKPSDLSLSRLKPG